MWNMYLEQVMSLSFHLLIKVVGICFLENVITLLALLGKAYFILILKGITVQK